MNHVKFVASSNLENIKTEDLSNVRYVDTENGKEREVLSSKKCVICDEYIWVVDNFNRQTILVEAFKIIDSRVYINGTPDYIKNSNTLFQCHWTCKNTLENQLTLGTFTKR